MVDPALSYQARLARNLFAALVAPIRHLAKIRIHADHLFLSGVDQRQTSNFISNDNTVITPMSKKIN
jgi:hypothetical protein